MTIPPTHSSELFDKLVEPFVPQWPYGEATITEVLSFGPKELEEIRVAGEARQAAMDRLVKIYTIGDEERTSFGTVKEFSSKGLDGPQYEVTFVRTNGGGHSNIVRWEGVIDFVGRVAKIKGI